MNLLKYIIQITPFRAGVLIVFLACLYFISFGENKPNWLVALDNRTTDSMFRLRGPQPTQNKVVIVNIDEKSLKHLGQWPWPRDIIAQLTKNITQAKVIGFDMVFAEKDRTSPHNLLAYLDKRAPGLLSEQSLEIAQNDIKLNNDLILGQTLANDSTVLGYIFLTENDGLKHSSETPFPSINIRTLPNSVPFESLDLFKSYRAITNVIDVSQSTSEGFLNFAPNTTGMVDKAPLFLAMDGIPYPSFALEMTRIFMGADQTLIHTTPFNNKNLNAVRGVSMDSVFVPTDEHGHVSVNYRGPVGTFPYLSAIDVLEGEHSQDFDNQIVIIGTSAAGLHDLRATPFSSIFPGVEIHATIIDNILAEDMMSHDLFAERGLTFLIIILGGLTLSAMLAYWPPLLGWISGFSLLALILAGNYYVFFLNHQVVGLTYPILVILFIFPTISILNYFFTGREKRFIDLAFSRYISPQVAHQLKRNPKQLSLSGQEKELSILFSDIRGFTTLSEQMTAKDLGDFINEYLTVMSKEILGTRGTVDKFIGDAIMAFWGAPLEDPDHVRNALSASLKMVANLNTVQSKWLESGMPKIEMGVGINTGKVSVGNFGSEDRFDYTVIGDNVNLASRLEGLTKLYGVPIIISEATYKIAEGFFCRQIDRVRVAGKTSAVSIYEPLQEGAPTKELETEVALYEKGLAYYFEQEFQDAYEIFHKIHGKSKLYNYHFKRIEKCLKTPPPHDWDGVTTHARK